MVESMPHDGRAEHDVESREQKPKVTLWRTFIATALGLIVILATVVVIEYESSTQNTVVQWSSYTIEGGPSVSNNSTIIIGSHFCVPADSSGSGIFSMIWSDTTGATVKNVRLWTILPPTTSHPLGVFDLLYEGGNNSSGGTSFLIHGDTPCDTDWIIDVASNEFVTVTAVTTLTYNVTSISH
ncbi:MAG TPA: hypothetical protein VMG81_06715 [Thermoplasmata archaeon]|nr:hypothetical protein [Thermoplasmata archaeon]